jgi:hypothetical protein
MSTPVTTAPLRAALRADQPVPVADVEDAFPLTRIQSLRGMGERV